MSVTDLAHEAARRYCAVLVSPESVEEALAHHGAPAPWRRQHVEALTELVRQAVETVLLEHITVAELTALARFYGTPEGRSVARKGIAFTAAIAPMLAAEVAAWARALRPQSEAQPASSSQLAGSGAGDRQAG